ncbi:hypothetical protein PILCRDRAFT_9185 [Piloderma croceum F 1598]|uniref:FUN14 domain-containing protein n=1 Tax=Piloderma croceum (strain F 1598) TaxID=765440 RepID=A0A0C3F7W5_PILCF|nr:hypothetical protein PILCRDRAFT_9185 [Piloderma croceum F 1598]
MLLSFGPAFIRPFAGIRPVFARQFAVQGPYCSSRMIVPARFHIQRTLTTEAVSVARSIPRKGGLPFIFTAAGVAGIGFGLTRSQIHCDSPTQPQISEYPSPPTSTVNFYELSFGTVCGLCAGIFIKKGAKAVAFLLGSVFVLLQYLGSTSVVRIDWARMGSRFENLFYTRDSITGNKKAPNVFSLWNWLVDFLTANFQQRASFLAGLALGLRVG